MSQEPPKIRVAIIGFAGSHLTPGEKRSLGARLYADMVEQAAKVITAKWKLSWDDVTLVSGGAAWSDHVAVSLFLAHSDTAKSALAVYIPAPLVASTGRLRDNGTGMHWRMNPGCLANALHEQFGRIVGRDTFADMIRAAEAGAVFDSANRGFHNRNSVIADKCDYMIAFSWSAGSEPTEGGTADTWFKCSLPRERKCHISMQAVAEKAASHGEKRRAEEK